MTDYLQLLIDNRMILGTFDEKKVSGLIPQWFWDRQVSLIDFRGDLQLRDNMSITFGFRVSCITASHDFNSGAIGPVKIKKVWVEKGVFVGSFSILYDCWLQEHSVVSVGSVVRGMIIPPYCMVEGNPARIIKEYIDGHWRPYKKVY